MTDLYDQHIDEMKARERQDFCMRYAINMAGKDRECENENRNTERLAAYKRKREAVQRYGYPLPGPIDSALSQAVSGFL